MLIGIKKNYFRSYLDVTSSEDKNILAVRVTVSDQLAYRIILAYGPQETESLEVRESFITEVSVELQHCNDNSEIPILLGDLNAKVEVQNEKLSAISGSGNGRLLCELVEKFELEVVNFSEVCDGKWTHAIRTTDAKSVLDYVIASKPFYNSVKSMIIDEDCVFCPFSTQTKKGEGPIEVFSDHNSIIIEASMVVPKRSQINKQYKWKLIDEGKVQLKEMTSIENYTPPQRDGTPQSQYDKFELEANKLLKSTAIHIKMKNKPDSLDKCPRRFLDIFKIITKFGARGKTQRGVAAQYKEVIVALNGKEVRRERAKCLKDTITSLTINGRFSRQQFWKVRKSVYRKFESCSSVLDKNGKEVFEEVLIMKAYEDEFKSRLSHRAIQPGLSEYEMKTNMLAKLYIEEATCYKGPPISLEELDIVIDGLKNGAPGSDIIPADFYTTIETGFKMYLLEILIELKETSWIPHQWESTLITTIYKNKGTRKVLKNHRGIFLTQIVAKLYEKILIRRKKDIMDKVTKLQAGSRTNRGPLDNLFLFQSCIDHAKYTNAPLYITVYDFAQCFDALWLEDCIVSLWKLGVRDETLSTLYNMNKKAVIQVKTPVGISNEFSQETIVKQGTVSGPPMCSTSTAEFAALNRVRGFPIGNFNVSTIILVDDILNANTAPDDVIISHENMKDFSHLKRLPVNGRKCFLLPINSKESCKIPCLKFEGIRMEVVDLICYLGNMFSSKGDNKEKIKDRVNKAKTCMIESISLCSEITLGVYIVQSLLLAQSMMFIPTLLFGAQTWTNLSVEDSKLIKTSQLQFLKRILRAPSSVCNSITYLELGVLPAQYEIHIMKLTFLHHILTLEEDDPVQLVYNEQLKIPEEKNWANELLKIRSTYKIEETDEEISTLLKDEWKALVSQAVKKVALLSLNEEKNSLSKSSSFPDAESFTPSSYLFHFAVTQACLLFRVRSRIINIKDVQRYKYGEDLCCRVCSGSEETIDHVLTSCPALTHQQVSVGDEYSDDLEVLECVIRRVEEFQEKVDEQEEEEQ